MYGKAGKPLTPVLSFWVKHFSMADMWVLGVLFCDGGERNQSVGLNC